MPKVPLGTCKKLDFGGGRVVYLCRTSSDEFVFKGPYRQTKLKITTATLKEAGLE